LLLAAVAAATALDGTLVRAVGPATKV